MNRPYGSSQSNYPMTRPTTTTNVAPADWDQLRQQARQLENEIDAKLMSFSKLCSNYLSRDHSSHYGGFDYSSSPSATSFETMSIDIEKLLEKLTEVNRQMSETNNLYHGSNTAASHTLQRHNDICQDYRREFERTKANIRHFQTREDLLMHSSTNSNEPLNNRRQDHYTREFEHLTHSNKLVDRALDMASTIKKDLSDQRLYFLQISHKVNALATRVPLMNNILQRIKIKKRKDSLVLAFLIAFCLIFLFVYIFR